MTVRWRLAVFFLQLLAIGLTTFAHTGTFFSAGSWYASLLALAVNSQLLVPYFPRPADVLANSVVALLIYFLAAKSVAGPGWHALAVLLILASVVSATALALEVADSKVDSYRSPELEGLLPFRANAISFSTSWLVIGGFWRYNPSILVIGSSVATRIRDGVCQLAGPLGYGARRARAGSAGKAIPDEGLTHFKYLVTRATSSTRPAYPFKECS